MGYAEIYRRAQTDPEGFWMEAAEAIDWVQPPSKALFADNAPLYEWFADGMVNTCWNAVDRHVEAGHGDRVAIIHDSPLTGTTHKITYAELQARVASLAGALRAKGVEKGDRVIIYMPMVPEAVEAMLACARIGAIHSVVFGGFARTNWPCGSTIASRNASSPPPAGSSRAGWCITSRCWMARWTWPRTSPNSA
jgi:propionyl-CoA synthetase